MEPLRPEDPTAIGGYPLLARIGAGGMGQVYLGLTGAGRHIALKVIREDFDGPQALARFRREVATVERVRSRFAAAMIGAGLEAPPYWLATEYVPGPTLRQTVAEHGPLPPATCMRLLAALAHGLLEIHRQGVQHRDLKPGNVILAPDGPRLIDFGIARGEGQTQITQTGAWNGTPGYVAPEVVREQQPLPASDVFSLAGTIAYAATGRPPFGGGRIEAIIHRTLGGEIDLDGADPRVAELVELCARKDPAERVTPERLLETLRDEAGDGLASDPEYRRRVTGLPPLPASVADAVTAGLVPPDRTTVGGPASGGLLGGRRGPLVAAAAAGVAVVVLGGAFAVRALTGGDGGTGGTGTGTVAATPSASGASGNPAGGGGTPGPGAGGASGDAGSPGAGAGAGAAGGPPPDELLLKQPTDDYQQMSFSENDHQCIPALRPEDSNLQRQMQVSAPRTPHSGDTVDLSVRYKWETPPDYYVAAEVRVPRGAQIGNAVSGAARSKPHLLTGSEWVELTYPTDFEWAGSGGAYPLIEGTWTIVWLHVHANGDAYYIGCDGFTVA
ncbi:serine/threonine-protein kinase [Actinomadura sp. WMMB 499]|uniref:serine/threonine-protein kinase n=1 Tax=Actinomadura sp. WMMB 499 TaxID=1219491 RepID=UPI001248460C|nr:serine/threonine-protein kinase [Actinomadura sp. WMMB 499]QFG24106.1 serine/threonine protein kinase [Actinomadura sp. WMMB 499]